MENAGTPSETSSQPSPPPKQCSSQNKPTEPAAHIAGYLINSRSGPQGHPGIAYDYLLAADGLYVQAKSPLLTASVLVAPSEVRGLLPGQSYFHLAHGAVPPDLLNHIVDAFSSRPHQETFASITWNGSAYQLHFPPQSATLTSLSYIPVPDSIAEFHSHPQGPPAFSRTDDEDEQSFKAYGVIADLSTTRPTITLRAGIYGHHAPLPIHDLFAL